jgi:tetraacyldisaccharide 4'-kinase
VRPWLAPLTPLYRLGLALRELGLRTGLEPVKRLRWPVISIGNLSTGGAGKTPFTITLARALARRQWPVVVLTRGYGRLGRVEARVDPQGSADQFGDEPLEIARQAGVPVYVAARRYRAGLRAEQDASQFSGVHLMDDGFQHRELYRDIDILLLDQRTWSRDRLLPAGNLREPRAAVRRADLVAIPRDEAHGLAASLRGEVGWQGPIWPLERRMNIPPIEGAVIAFCGIARSEQFFAGLKRAGLRLADSLAFADHHRYTRQDLERLCQEARRRSAVAFLTTEKDRLRLGSLAATLAEVCPLRTAGLEILIENEEEAIAWLIGRLSPQPES